MSLLKWNKFSRKFTYFLRRPVLEDEAWMWLSLVGPSLLSETAYCCSRAKAEAIIKMFFLFIYFIDLLMPKNSWRNTGIHMSLT